ncbi:MAG: CHAT domain-containing tetratricopeptide repeat protein [Bacteroidota bacterium]
MMAVIRTILLLLACGPVCLLAQLAEQAYEAKLDSLSDLIYEDCGSPAFVNQAPNIEAIYELARAQNDLEGQFMALDWQVYCASESELLAFLKQGLLRMDSLYALYKEQMPESDAVSRQISIDFFYGSYHYRFGDFAAASPRFRGVLKLLDKYPENELIDYKTSAYRYLGSIYRHQGNSQAAIEIYQAARAHNLQLENLLDWGLDSKYLADTYKQRQDFGLAGKYYREALRANEEQYQLNPKSLRTRNRLVATLHAFAELCLFENQSDSSLSLLQAAQALIPPEDPALAETFQLFGKSYLQKEDFERAKQYYQLALAATELQFGRQSLAVGENLRLLGDLFTAQADYTLALTFYQQSLESLVPGFEQDRLADNPSLEGLYLRKELLYTLGNKAQALREMHLAEPDHVMPLTQIAYETVALAVSLIDSLKTDYTDDADKQLLVDESYPIIELGLELAQSLYAREQDPTYLAAAYRLMEKSRAVALFQSLKTARAQDFAGIPLDLQASERQYRYELNLLRDSLRQQTDPAQNPDRLQRFQALKKDYQSLLARFETEYPEYYRLKYDQSVLPLESLQTRLLTPEACMLEYFVGEKDIYLLDVRQSEVHFFKLPNDFGLASLIQDFRAGIYEFFVSGSAYDDQDYQRLGEQYVMTAYQLHQSLFAPYLSDSLDLADELVIVPDGMLGYLPFGALLQTPAENATTFRTHDYLLRSHNISYVPSASLWDQMQNEDPLPAKAKLLAFAPIFSGESGDLRSSWIRDSLDLAALPYTEQELVDIKAVFSADTYLNEEASLSHFQKWASEYRLIHLATHGVLNDEDPDQSFLAFYPSRGTLNQGGRLMLRELYSMDIAAEMVVLSACETGIGRFSRGEGLLSLARGFSYAGTRSLLATLWRIPDGEVNKDLLPNFYLALKEGKTKSAAMRSAQLAQVNEAFTDQLAHPFFWAAFTPIGDMRPLQKSHHYWWWGFALGLILVLIAVWVSRNKKQNL